jgi:L-aspartate oxidase
MRTADVLVVGSGIAGCAAALGAARGGADVLVVTKASRPDDASTDWAQGGIATARGDPGSLKADVLEASAGTADEAAVDVLVEEADEVVRDVLVETLDVDFDGAADEAAGGEDGGYDYAREAAHSEHRILHVDAATGKHLLRPFLNHIDGHDRVEVLEDTAALELVTHEGRVHGALVDTHPTGEPVYAGATVLATGGIGDCYGGSTNPPGSTGDGVAMAALAGADVADMEFVQFHPTGYVGDDPFLVSEAVRGEGALLVNGEGERFMPDYHEDAELAPRDVVARAVQREREATGEVLLDVSPLPFREEFPDLAANCDERGVELPHIPVGPVEHFLCGGVDVDHHGRASLDRLYAVGECARTGVHGANRLASTSLLEGLVWGLRAGEDAATAGGPDPDVEPPELRDRDPALPDRFAAEKFTRLRRVMDEHVGLRRDPEGLGRAQAVLRRLKGEVDAYVRTRTDRSLYELRNAAVVALLVARAASENGESVGCHYLVDESGKTDERASPEA